jgi:1-acyl-sn-glycerol-3-phosphate acyltransferase
LAALVLKPLLVLFFKRDWRGMEHIPAHGGFITVVNHNSHLDSLSYAHYQYNTGRVARFLAKDSLFRAGVVGRFMRGARQIPVYRGSKDAADSLRAAVAAVRRGECVAFYPEGTLTRDPDLWPMEGKTGAARVALATRVPVVPVAQWGAQAALPPYGGLRSFRPLPRKTLTVVAGEPVELADLYDREPSAEVLREATERIMDAITGLLAQIRQETPPATRYVNRRVPAERPGPGAPDPGTPAHHATEVRTPELLAPEEEKAD